MNVIEARGLTKVYGGRAVVRDFSMTVAASDIYGFVGKNGAGKSTVMKMICGDALPTAGEVVLFESDRAATGAAGAAGPDEGGVRRIGVLIEEPGLLLNLSAYRNLMAKALAWGIVDGPARCEEVLRLIEQGKIDTSPLITHRFPLDRIEEAYRIFENKEDGVIKIAVYN